MEILILILLCVGMFIGAIVGGYIPLMVKLSEFKMRLISAFGAGLLIGCSLIVIIPEGIETLTKARVSSLPKDIPNVINTMKSQSPGLMSNEKPTESIIQRRDLIPDENNIKEKEINKLDNVIHEVPTSLKSTSENKESETEENYDHKTIGLALIAGFGFMFLVDYFMGSHHHSHIAVPSRLSDIHSAPAESNNITSSTSFSAALGLLIHSAADGLAMGAASVSNQQTIGIVIFFAIMLHKAPAAFGLTTFMLQSGENNTLILTQLIIFASAAPFTSILTHLILSFFNFGSTYILQWYTGWLLLFSGGTFLFVATVHSLPTIKENPDFSHYELITLMLGMLFPMILPLDE